ncbi:MAG: glycoside hydrolase family 43 protein [Actinobacteria bacterium]|nr:glycoside hydrolase family 43 protein [Actinomycetota bacterium]
MSFVRTRAVACLAALVAIGLVLPASAAPTPAAVAVPYDGDFPDPHVLPVADGYVAYSTTTAGRNLRVLRSTDLRTWTVAPVPGADDALPQPAVWSAQREGDVGKETWAPSVLEIGGRYVAYYAVLSDQKGGRFCISAATALAPEGPFVDTSTAPLVCDRDPHGSIDPYAFRDPRTSRLHLLWKSEGLPGATPQRLMSRELAADGLSFAAGSVASELLRPAEPWEADVVENPAMVHYRGALYLFYSGNRWDSADYAEGWARCRTPAGPCVRGSRGPLLASSGKRLGPAGASAFVDTDGRLRLAYHYWTAPHTTYPRGERRMRIAAVRVTATGLTAIP